MAALGPDGEDSGQHRTRRGKMDEQYKAHRREVMQSPDAMRACLLEHGVAEDRIPQKRQDQFALHTAVHPETIADAQDEPKADEPKPDEPKPAPRTRTRKAPAADKTPAPVPDGTPGPDIMTPPARSRTRKPATAKAAPKADETVAPVIPLRGRGRKPAAAAAAEPKLSLADSTVPYPAKLVQRGRDSLVATCPACGRTYVEKVTATGEQTTHNYEAHYAKEHKYLGETAKPATRTRRTSKTATAAADAKAQRASDSTGRASAGTATKPATRTRKPAASKPAQRGRKPAAATKPATRTRTAPKPVPAAANGTSPRVHKQELARELLNLVAEHFAGHSAADKERVSYWLRSMPVGNPEIEGRTVGGPERWWPKSLPRPVGAGWEYPVK